MSKRAAVFFIASPLHYLAAQSIMRHFENDADGYIFYVKPMLEEIIDKAQWFETAYMPWPRHDPLPGLFGRMRRIRENLHKVVSRVKDYESIHIHAHEYDTEAYNYFINFIPKAISADIHFRIIPDGIANLSLHPLSFSKYAWHCLRKVRQIFLSELNYRCFNGDRLGTQADFIDRIYVLPGFDHPYDSSKVKELPSLINCKVSKTKINREKSALIVGQWLVDFGQLTEKEALEIKLSIYNWLKENGIKQIYFKPHPRDSRYELMMPDYKIIDTKKPIELIMSQQYFDIVISVNSTALFTAKMIYGDSARVLSFGLSKLKFKSLKMRKGLIKQMEKLGMEIL
ncbi:polysialyltransferase family glycosyltransferase [Hydrogenimonas thermophila]|uniref:Uncharacterized protein n=1 Tax=Hydrogenimonas thermophila TaxID=223786 RepID=A0A1I5U3T3_9BACT|nr:polysialyltransferase family glycosyltransferase [Hydrogenimonas thermophila]SFP89871.1 hypothetical protein SAMN05216234_1545 [Hydrogenimonas thermophila]